jgi:RHS repeat-associated protein
LNIVSITAVDGTQYWSDVVYVIAHEETDVEMPLEQLALNKTNDPNPVRYDGEPPTFEPEGIKVASIGSLAGILSQTVIANTSTPKVYYYLNDHLGTPQLMTDENNVVVWEAKYKPFGEAIVHPYSTVENNVRLPGQYYDQETGLHYNYHRYYDTRTGRYLMPDPSHSVKPEGMGIPYLVPFILDTPQELNLYPYVINNPVRYVDTQGLRKMIPLVPIYKSGCVIGAMARLIYCIKNCKEEHKCEHDMLRACVDGCYDVFEFTVEIICGVKMIEPKPAYPAEPSAPIPGGGGGSGGAF